MHLKAVAFAIVAHGLQRGFPASVGKNAVMFRIVTPQKDLESNNEPHPHIGEVYQFSKIFVSC